MPVKSSRSLLVQPLVKAIDAFLRAGKRTGEEHPVLIDEMVIVNDERIEIEIFGRRRELRHVELKVQLRARFHDGNTGKGERQRKRRLMQMPGMLL